MREVGGRELFNHFKSPTTPNLPPKKTKKESGSLKHPEIECPKCTGKMKYEKEWELRGKGSEKREQRLIMVLYRCTSKACNATLRFRDKGEAKQ